MSVDKELIILAVTKMHGGVCTAGVDAEGRWVRPIRSTADPSRALDYITDHCLLPLDFFHGGKSHLVNFGVTRFRLTGPAPVPPHTEDWLLDTNENPQLVSKLNDEEQRRFLAAHAEDDFTAWRQSKNRSLGLFPVRDFAFRFSPNLSGEDISVRASFKIGRTSIEDCGCTDLRMRALGRKLLEKRQAGRRVLDEADFRRHGKEATYLALGLSRLHKGRHWLIVVGVHSIPELDVEVDYARL